MKALRLDAMEQASTLVEREKKLKVWWGLCQICFTKQGKRNYKDPYDYQHHWASPTCLLGSNRSGLFHWLCLYWVSFRKTVAHHLKKRLLFCKVSYSLGFALTLHYPTPTFHSTSMFSLVKFPFLIDIILFIALHLIDSADFSWECDLMLFAAVKYFISKRVLAY